MVTESETHACQTERVTLNDAEIERASEGGRREGLTERKEQQDRRVTDTRQGRAGCCMQREKPVRPGCTIVYSA